MSARSSATRRILRITATLLIIAAFLAPGDPAAAAAGIEGAGSSFVQLELEQWRSDISRDPFNIKMNYVSSGSTFGRQQYVANLVDFAMSDIPFEPEELGQAAARPYTYVTLSAGGIGFMYNLKDGQGRRVGLPANKGGTGTDLKLRPRTVCRIFTQRMYWDDPELVADNPDINLPHNLITPVYRSDGAGTTYVVHEYCQATASDVWRTYIDKVKSDPATVDAAPAGLVDGRPTSKWADVGVATSAFAGDGVADFVASDVAGQNSITYVEAGFAEVRNFPNALVRNEAGVFQYPEAAQVTRTLSHARRNDDATVTLEFLANDPDAYFPSSYSYAIVPTSGIDADKANSLGTFLNYAVTLGQAKADELGYAPLSAEVVDISLNEIQQIPGAPPKPEIVVYEPEYEAPQTGGGGPVVDSGGGGTGSGATAGGGGGGGSGGTGGGSGGTGGGSGSTGGGTGTEGGATGTTGEPCPPSTTTTTVAGASTTTSAPTTSTVPPTSTTVAIGLDGLPIPTTTTAAPCVPAATGGTGTTSSPTGAQAASNNGVADALGLDGDPTAATGPTNTQVLLTLAQGATIAAAGAAVATRFSRRGAA